jgi:hypothetical protein
MKKWSMIMAVVMALLLTAIIPMSALAQDGDDITTDTAAPRLRDGLAIVAPLVVPTDTKISMTVFGCWDQEPVEGAGIWLVSREKMEVLRQEMAAVRGNDDLDAEQDAYERLLDVHATFLGRTDKKGKLWHSFDGVGRYILVAVKRGYLPDSRPIAVGMRPRALAIHAPWRAEVGKDVTIAVYRRGTENPVAEVGVWAFTREDAESLKATVSGIRESGDQAALEVAVEEACDIHGIFLGTTDDNGKVSCAFENTGRYVLLARKPGFYPGWRPIAIVNPLTADVMERPQPLEGSSGIEPSL